MAMAIEAVGRAARTYGRKARSGEASCRRGKDDRMVTSLALRICLVLLCLAAPSSTVSAAIAASVYRTPTAPENPSRDLQRVFLTTIDDLRGWEVTASPDLSMLDDADYCGVPPRLDELIGQEARISFKPDSRSAAPDFVSQSVALFRPGGAERFVEGVKKAQARCETTIDTKRGLPYQGTVTPVTTPVVQGISTFAFLETVTSANAVVNGYLTYLWAEDYLVIVAVSTLNGPPNEPLSTQCGARAANKLISFVRSAKASPSPSAPSPTADSSRKAWWNNNVVIGALGSLLAAMVLSVSGRVRKVVLNCFRRLVTRRQSRPDAIPVPLLEDAHKATGAIAPGWFVTFTAGPYPTAQDARGRYATAIAEVVGVDGETVALEWRDRSRLPSAIPVRLLDSDRVVKTRDGQRVSTSNRGLRLEPGSVVTSPGWAAHLATPYRAVDTRVSHLSENQRNSFEAEADLSIYDLDAPE